MSDTLFLLGPYFQNDAGEIGYCGDSAPVEGLLAFFPILRKLVDVRYLDAARPRKPVVDLLGTEHQSLPVLVLASPDGAERAGIKASFAQGRWFIDSEADIRSYLTTRYNIAKAA